ncbi:MAG: UxaA family hydrolase [Clostridioides sp.]|jgi:altronate dehydratase large subunit|nr:UxaA family hydrolase [Clostridioides sp.]
MNFYGYKRPDGKVGIRNHVLILPTSICASDTTRIIASQVEGAVTFNNQNGCSQVPPDMKLTMDILVGYAANPNIYGTVIVSLGCENCQNDLVEEAIKQKTNKPIKKLVIQQEGGTIKTVEKGVRYAKEMVIEASKLQKESFPISELILGTNCGGSDLSSGLGANPLLGSLSDYIVEQGATSVLCETTEFLGAEHILARRGRNEEISKKIYGIVHDYEKALERVGEEIRSGNPSPGNIAGGLTTLEEKSLGCIHKGGKSTINEVYGYAEELKTKEGLVIMDTPGNDAASVAGLIAGGCQIVLFTTGLGTPTGNAVAPVLKITANKKTYEMMEDNIDFDATGMIYGPESEEELRDKLMSDVIDVCNGKLVKAESLGYIETAIARYCNYM